MNEDALDEKIRKRAYELWEKDGSPDGQADRYWDAARRQIESELDGGPGGKAPSSEPPTAS